MAKNMVKKDFDFYIDQYMCDCQSRRLRPKTMNSYEQRPCACLSAGYASRRA